MLIPINSDYHLGRQCAAVPGGRWERGKGWVIDDVAMTPRGALIALKLFPHLQVEYPHLAMLRDSVALNARPTDYSTGAWATLSQAFYPRLDVPYHDFQKYDLAYTAARLQHTGSAYIGWERGLGKTVGALSLIDLTGAERVLIVVPNTSKEAVWKPEWEKWAADKLPHEFMVLPNAKKHREAMLETFAGGHQPPTVLVIHWEALNVIAKMRANNRGWDRLGKWDLVIADEAHRLANKKALWTRNLKKIKTDMKLALSGSIVANHGGELYSPLNWLYPDRYHNQLRDWDDRFIDTIDLEGHRTPIGFKVEALPALRDELGRFMVYRRKADELDLPPITYQDLPVRLSPQQRRVYDDLQDYSIAELDSQEVITAANGLALLTKLRQAATGLDLLSGDVVDSSKIDTAVELINDNQDEAFVVFSYFVGAAEALAKRLGPQAFVVHGGVKHADRVARIAQFQAGVGRVFVGTLGTLAESVTLSRASNVVFLDRSWNPVQNDQATDRVAGGFRALQVGRPITVTNLIAENTVDESRVTPVLSNKAAVRAMILGATQR